MLNKTEILNGLSRTFGRASLQLKKHSPEILVGAGIVGGVASAVMACKATLKVNEALEEPKANIEKIHNYVEEHGFSEKYTEEDSKKDLTIVYVQGAVKVAKLYAPAVILGTLSITSILAGHNILRKRNVALAAAYTVIDKSFKDYRGRVIERFGKELDRELKYGIKSEEVEKVVVNEDGTESVVKEVVEVVDPNEISEFARIFDNGCAGWEKDPEYNLMFLKRQQSYFNDLLKRRGHVFLNEVYDALGFPRSKAGQEVGWYYDEEHPNGDNFIDFGIFDIHNPKKRDFVNGYERSIILDFNVDGPILHLI